MFRALIAIVLTALVAGCETPDGLIHSQTSLSPNMKDGAMPASSALLLGKEDEVNDVIELVFKDGRLDVVIPETEMKPGDSIQIRITEVAGSKDYNILEVALSDSKKSSGRYDGVTMMLTRRDGLNFEVLSFSSAKVLEKGLIPGLVAKKSKDNKPQKGNAIEREASTSKAMFRFYERATSMIVSGELEAKTFMPFVIIDTTAPGTIEKIKAQVEANKLAKKLEKEAKTRQKDQLANKDKWYGKWLFTLSEDAITDERKLYAYSRPDGYTDWDTGPWLRIGCYAPDAEYPMGVTLVWRETLAEIGNKDGVKLAHVTSRIDKKQPQEMVWALADNLQDTYPPGPYARDLRTQWTTEWTAQQLHSSLRKGGRVVFRGYPANGQPVTLIFDLDGYTDAIKNFEPHCNQ